MTENQQASEHGIEVLSQEWDAIDETTQERLFEWYNVRERDLTTHDLKILADLHHSGNIRFGECVGCGMTCYEAHPKSWDEFQGTGVGMMDGIYHGTATFCGECYIKIRDKAEEAGVI